MCIFDVVGKLKGGGGSGQFGNEEFGQRKREIYKCQMFPDDEALAGNSLVSNG